MSLRILLVLAALLCSFSALAGDIAIDYDRGMDWAAHKTYAWKEGTPAPSPTTDKRIVESVDKALAAAGLTKVDKNPDLWVSYHVISQKEAKITDYDYGKFKFNGRDVTVKKLIQGTLAVDIVDASLGKLGWRGAATEYVPTDAPAGEGVIEKAVSLMFKNFPPPKEG